MNLSLRGSRPRHLRVTSRPVRTENAELQSLPPTPSLLVRLPLRFCFLGPQPCARHGVETDSYLLAGANPFQLQVCPPPTRASRCPRSLAGWAQPAGDGAAGTLWTELPAGVCWVLASIILNPKGDPKRLPWLPEELGKESEVLAPQLGA